MKSKNIASFTTAELQTFLDSFDDVFCDCDGVIWQIIGKIPNIAETISTLKKYGKRVRYVSNNSTGGIKYFQEKFKKLSINVETDDIIYPTLPITAYLKKVKFNKEIFIIGTSMMKQEFTNAGFLVADSGPDAIEESPHAFEQHTKDNKNIGAVVIDIDFNLNYIKLTKTLMYLQRPEVLLIFAATDKRVPAGSGLNSITIGPGEFQNVIIEATNRIPLHFGKPSIHLKKFLNEKFHIQSPSRTLFIGDSLEQDIKFAAECRYQKLLVLTGVSTLKQIEECTNEDMIPDFYVNSLADLHDLFKNRLNI